MYLVFHRWLFVKGNERRNDRGRDENGSDRRRDMNSRSGRPPLPTGYKVQITGLPSNLTWRELKDFVRRTAEPTYANVKGSEGIVEFATEGDMRRAIRELDNVQFEGNFIKVAEKYNSNNRRSFDRSYRRSRSGSNHNNNRNRRRSRSNDRREKNDYSKYRSRSRSHSRTKRYRN